MEPAISINSPCEDALHTLRTDESMQIVSAEADGGRLFYTLTERPSQKSGQIGKKKTAILVCHLPE